jgi:sugar phosphate isomerase/epimerase
MQASMDAGVVDFGWVVSALKEKGYEGAVAIEYLDGAEGEAVKLRDLLIDLGLTL